ncbi:hypothetical protein ETD86_34865 [Nonomuraea turkmeniaca]|uniref:Phage tail assembly protein n=1 Tax=Nonomuraea turkmeniaca TaxID=103838 RepID=A0A5S4F6F8_9ACTN|nr:hypothetical protein [Nonomuraea turkmeniaca]TMR11753.1 hypothetical protein ETD86_34865 [Nonomuraea turkmeniaca]
MAKIHIGDDSVEFDLNHLPLHEGIALQKATGWRIKQLVEALQDGDMLAIAGLAWLALKRMGKDVTFADIESGVYPIDLASISVDVEEEPDPSLNGEAKTSPANA